MKALRPLALGILGAACLLTANVGYGQIVINEIVDDEQDFESTDVAPDTREFIELYNAGPTAVNIGNWTLNYYQLGTTPGTGSYALAVDTIPAGTMLAPGDFFVIGPQEVPNVDLILPSATDLLPNANSIFELWDGPRETATLRDAVALETFRNSELANANQTQLNQIAAGETVGPGAKGGWWGQIESNNAHPSNPSFPNRPLSIGRYLDGRDSNVNGRDWGMIPATPGTSNNLPQVASHVVPDVTSAAVGNVLRDDYYASFKLPRVIDPDVVDTYNPNRIPRSPQGGNAIIAWDETGGGNAVFSDHYVNKFELSAFIDPRPFNVTAADTNQSEATIYGIGTTDMFFATPNSADLLTGQPGTGGNILSSANGSTGIGWLIQRRTSNVAGTQNSAAVLQLIDFNDGGDGVLADAPDWEVIQTIDLTGMNADWHTLSIEYDPATGAAIGKYDTQTFTFNTLAGLVGNFYVGYREALPGTGSPIARPPTYDLVMAQPPAMLAGDYNNNGTVDAADYVVWRDNSGTNNTLPNNTLPGPIGQAHYDQWRTNFGRAVGGPAAAQSQGVPEPGSIALAAFGILACAAGKRRSQQP